MYTFLHFSFIIELKNAWPHGVLRGLGFETRYCHQHRDIGLILQQIKF